MRIAAGVGGEVIGRPMAPRDVVEQVVDAEAAGFGADPGATMRRTRALLAELSRS
jgi:hypothetical protein